MKKTATIFMVLLVVLTSRIVYADKVFIDQRDQNSKCVEYFYTEDFKALNSDNTRSSFEIRLFLDYPSDVFLSVDKENKIPFRRAVYNVLMNKNWFQGHAYHITCYDKKGKIVINKNIDVSLGDSENMRIMVYYAERTNYYEDQFFQSAMNFYNTIKALRNASPEKKRQLYEQWKALYPQYVNQVPPIQ